MKRLALAAVVGLLTLAGCTDVPEGSSPSVIQTQVLQPQLPPPDKPAAGLSPRTVVTSFLDRNAKTDPNHQDARQFLTASANTRWSDDRVTVLTQPYVGAVGRDGTVKITGAKLGFVDATGAYTPVLAGDGSGDPSPVTTFHLSKVSGQWRIDKLPSGLLVSASQFESNFQQPSLYFYDATEKHLVPDPRYTQLTDPSDLATWFLRTLAAGPRNVIAAAAAQVAELPNQTDVSRLSVTVGTNSADPVKIVIPGAAQTDRAQRVRLAAELAKTFEQVPDIGTTRAMQIFDGTEPVAIPGAGDTFTAAQYAETGPSVIDSPELYYVNAGGGVVDGSGVPLPGRIGGGYYDLSSVALQRGSAGEGLRVAGVRLANGVETLDVGTEAGPLRPVAKVTGALSRPDWAPGVPEFWIGSGAILYRVSAAGSATKVPVATASGPAQGQIESVRFSPDGGRVALVLSTRSTDGLALSQVWIGAVVRSGGTARVEGLSQITAAGIAVTDVAWNDELKIFGVGHDVATSVPGFYEFQCDGSRLSLRGTGILPGEPQTITVASGQDAAVSVGESVFKQLAGTWESLYGDDEVAGRAPIYVR